MRAFVALSALVLACGGAGSKASPAAPVVAPRSVDMPSGAAAPPSVGEHDWLTKLDRDSPLVGKIWDAGAAAFVSPSAMLERLSRAKFVLVGERHDNPDHHRLQAKVIAELVARGRRPAVVLE